jgi:hypothetical protein
MNNKPEPKNRKKSVETPVHTIREGDVAASIWRRMSPAGYEYFDFSLCRSWKSLSTASTASSRNFFAKNQEEIVKVVAKASRWIIEQETTNRQTMAA